MTKRGARIARPQVLGQPDFVVGVDLGQAHDPTAIAVAELVEPDTHIRHLERLPLGTPYPAVVARIAAVVVALPGAELVVDATGVGRPVVDQLRAAGLAPIAVTLTGGRNTTFDGDDWRVPKRELVRAVATALEGDRLKVASGLPDAPALVREMAAFRIRFGERGHASFAGAGEHDDLLIAVALLCWRQAVGRRLARVGNACSSVG